MGEPVDVTAKIAARRESVKAALRKNDLVLPERPKYDVPRLPVRITDLDDNQLMQLLVRFTRYQDHLAGQVAEAEIDEQTAESALELAKAKGVIRTWSGGSDSRVTIEKARTAADDTVTELNDHYLTKKARRKLLSVMCDSMARDASVVSREISRRIGRDPHERRAERWSP